MSKCGIPFSLLLCLFRLAVDLAFAVRNLDGLTRLWGLLIELIGCFYDPATEKNKFCFSLDINFCVLQEGCLCHGCR